MTIIRRFLSLSSWTIAQALALSFSPPVLAKNTQAPPQTEETATEAPTGVQGTGGAEASTTALETPSPPEENGAADRKNSEQNEAAGSKEPNAAMAQSAPLAAELASLDTIGLLARADEVKSELSELEAELVIPKELERLRSRLAKQEEVLAKQAAKAQKNISEASRWFLISDIQFEFQQRLRLLKEQRGPLDKFASRVAGVPEKLELIQKEWTHSRSLLAKVGSPATVVGRANEILRTVQLLKLRHNRAEAAVLRTRAYFERMNGTIETVLRKTETDAPSLLRDFTHRSTDESGDTPFGVGAITKSLATAHAEYRRTLYEFFRVSASHLAFQLLLLLCLVFALFKCRSFYRERDAEPRAADHLVLRHPWAGAVLISTISVIWIYPTYPAVVGLLTVSFAILAVSFLLLDENNLENRLLIGGKWLLVFFLTAHMYLTGVPRVERWLIFVEGVAVLFFSLQFSRSTAVTWTGFWHTLSRLVTRFWAISGALGLICWLVGFDRSAAILIDGTARLMLITLAFRVGYDVLASIVVLGVESPWARRFRVFEHHGTLIADRLNFAIRWILAFYWFRATLNAYAVLEDAKVSYDLLLKKEIGVGSIELQLSSLALLIVGVLVAVYTSRFVRFFLEEELLPRTRMSLGSRAAVTSGAGYVVLGFGLFTALAAVGFELDKIAILVSALGVGIGFGLQNIVQNFVAGIILIFGRPINVGDRVQIGELLGTVSEVGFRASIVKTIQGAEVIVPNSQFVSDQVINWSLSDDRRRIELDVGVKYGTDPTIVLEILLKAAEEHPLVLSDPKTEAVFMAFGDSSLDFQLRAWTAQGGEWIAIRSDLSVAIDKAFKEAGIEIPFPQRDLHLRSIDQEAIDVLLSGKTSGKD